MATETDSWMRSERSNNEHKAGNRTVSLGKKRWHVHCGDTLSAGVAGRRLHWTQEGYN